MAVWDVRVARGDDGKTLSTQITADGYVVDDADISLAHFYHEGEYIATVKDYFYIKKVR